MDSLRKKINRKIIEKYGDLIDRVKSAGSNEILDILAELIRRSPYSYQILLRNNAFAKLLGYVISRTSFLPSSSRLSTRCWYVINNIDGIIRCHNCGKPILKDIKITEKSNIFWCSPKCQSEDAYIRNKISASKFRSGNIYTESVKSSLPEPIDILYSGFSICYNDDMNLKLREFFKQHSRSFQFWIEKRPDIKKYLFEKSYPINATRLKIETRVKWVLDKMQRFPACKACGRPIDFMDVKLSHQWPQYCCVECKKSMQSEVNCDRHASDIYRRMLDSEWTQPLFTLEEFKNANRKTHCFDVKCIKCGGIFKLHFDQNFYARNKKASYFRCPNCFPFNSSRKTSSEEIELFEYVKSILGTDDMKRGDRISIYPYELDIHPIGKYQDFAIEYNGAYWHSVELNNDVNRVLNKVKACEYNGIKLIVVWEDDYLKDKEYYRRFIYDYIFNATALVDKLTDGGLREKIELDRSIFNKCFCIPGYELIAETPPAVTVRSRPGASQVWTCPDAGKLIYRKIAP